MRFIIIGLGHHAKRIYLPYFIKSGHQIAAVVEIEEQVESTKQYLNLIGHDIPVISSPYLKDKELPNTLVRKLDAVGEVDGIVISTDPQVHMAYSRWAIQRRFNILLDKPISTYRNVANDPDISGRLIDDYDELNAAYRHFEDKTITIATQRRYHPGFDKVHDLINDVAHRFRVPVTAIDAHHSDGQWRLPSELEKMEYHGFTNGNGKLSHSGYHLFDSVSQLVQDSYAAAGKDIDSIRASSYFTKPEHIINQLDYSQIFDKDVSLDHEPDFTKYGEHDAVINGMFSSGKHRRTLFTISLLHNSVSDRHWIRPRKDLYKKNGRIKHEFFNIQQGPLQNIQIHSFQSKSDHDDPFSEGTGVGSNSHFEIHVFRNAKICGGESYQVIDVNEHVIKDEKLITEQSKIIMCDEFVKFCSGDIAKNELRSDVNKHGMGVALLTLSYKSGASNNRDIRVTRSSDTWGFLD